MGWAEAAPAQADADLAREGAGRGWACRATDVPPGYGSDDVQQDEQQQGSDDRDQNGAEAPQLAGEEAEHALPGPRLGLGAAALRAVAQAEALGAFA